MQSNQQRGQSISVPIRLRAWGDHACFTRPEMKAERYSYDVMTPSAARGILEAIYWKPEMQWIVTRIDVLKPIRRASVRRNEVRSKAPVSHLKKAMSGKRASLGLNIVADRVQRASIILRDVSYDIHARIELTGEGDSSDNISKHWGMFIRRARGGQCFHRPCFGNREFAAHFALAENCRQAHPIRKTADLGVMLFDIDYSQAPPRPMFFHARMESGSIIIPRASSPEVLR